MKIAIMQPYLFPYIGYFQLINAVDKFIIYNDVTFIKQGWINRNRILAEGSALFFSIPLNGASSYKLIRDVSINELLYDKWKKKFYKTLDQYYKKAHYYEKVLSIIKIALESKHQLISAVALCSIKEVCEYLAIETEIAETVDIYSNNYLKGEDRIIDICRHEAATDYINAEGGRSLYSRNAFEENKIELRFIKSNNIVYKQFDSPFVPFLSIIDVMMFNSSEEIRRMLDDYELL
jgi:hypothetical protein